MTITGSGSDIIVEGNKCDRGYDFSMTEMTNPMRTLTTTVRTKFPGVPVLSVRTAAEIPKGKLMEAMHELSGFVIDTELGCGDTVLENIVDTGVSVIVTSAALKQLGAELENKNAEIEKRGSSGGPSAAASPQGGIGIVVNPGALDDLDQNTASGFVGAAGEAVGVAGVDDEDAQADEPDNAEERSKMKSRPHIKRK